MTHVARASAARVPRDTCMEKTSGVVVHMSITKDNKTRVHQSLNDSIAAYHSLRRVYVCVSTVSTSVMHAP